MVADRVRESFFFKFSPKVQKINNEKDIHLISHDQYS